MREISTFISTKTHIPESLCLIQAVCHYAEVGLTPTCAVWDSL